MYRFHVPDVVEHNEPAHEGSSWGHGGSGNTVLNWEFIFYHIPAGFLEGAIEM